MFLLTKEGDELAIVFSPEEKIRIGDTLLVDGIVVQVMDMQFADLPGVLEHILRKSLISKAEVKEDIQPEVRSVIDLLTDQKLAIAKIRGRIIEEDDQKGQKKRVFKTGLSEFNLSRAKADIKPMDQNQLFESLGLRFQDSVDLCRTLSVEAKGFDILAERLGINLVTGMKGSGKSYFAKRLLLRLIERGVLTLVFDLNGEYVNLWKDTLGKPNEYATRIRVMTPYIRKARMNEMPLLIPLNEISYDDFAHFMSVQSGTPSYQSLVQFWLLRKDTIFDLNDLEDYLTAPDNVKNEAVRIALEERVKTAKALGLFGPCDLLGTIKGLQERGGALIFNLSLIRPWERGIIVDFVLRKLSQLGHSKEIRAVSLFLEEAQLYISQENMVNVLTRMRHFGIFPTFITNDPRTLPDEVFTLLDNLVAFMFRNEDELRHLTKTGLTDERTAYALKNLESKQCLVVGNVSSNYPVFVEVRPQSEVMMGGETRKLIE